MGKEIKFIYFDQGGVLFTEVGLRQLAKELGIDYVRFQDVYAKYGLLVCKGKMTGNELWHKYQEEIGFEYPMDNYIEYWARQSEPVTATHELVKDLAKKYSIGLLTNVYPGMEAELIRQGMIPPIDYAAVVQSCEVGYAKPEKEFYQIAQSKAGIEPESILLIDNVERFLVPAKELGWQTFWFKDNKAEAMVKELSSILL